MGTRPTGALALMAQQHEVVHVIYCQSRSTLADTNENRDWRIYADFAHDSQTYPMMNWYNEQTVVFIYSKLIRMARRFCLSMAEYCFCWEVIVFKETSKYGIILA